MLRRPVLAKRVRRLLLFAGSAFAFGYVFFCYNLAKGYLSPIREIPPLPDGFAEKKVPTRFGPNPTWSAGDPEQANTAYILVHGYGGNREYWTEIAKELEQRGNYVLIPAMPGQDASPAPKVGFGIYEADVILDTVKAVRTLKDAPSKVVVVGVSMGGSATWIAAQKSLKPGEPKIDAVVTDGAYAVFREAMDSFFNRKLPGGSFLLRPVVWFAESMSDVKSEAVKPVDAAASWKGRPALVIQGQADTLIVPSHGDRLSKAAGCRQWKIPNAVHAESFEADRNGYIEGLTSVLDSPSPSGP